MQLEIINTPEISIMTKQIAANGYESDIILYEAAAKAIKAAGITKLPSLAALQAEYAALQEQKEALYADYARRFL